MGIHEGAHAYTAFALGDDTAEQMGKRTFDPFRHINWTELNSILFAVIMPVVTAMQGLIPMGIAWVPVNPALFRKPQRDAALVAVAGPFSNFVLALVLLLIHLGLSAAGLEPFVVGRLLFCVYITSIVYGLFNMVPIPPLDGSRVLYFFLPARGREIMEDLEPYGFLILIAVFMFGSGGNFLRPAIGFFSSLW